MPKNSFLHFFWPQACLFCGRLGGPVCDPCLLSLTDSGRSYFCLECGADLPCSRHPLAVPCMGASLYHRSSEVIRLMKYCSCRGVAGSMGRTLAGIFEIPPADCLVPVPLHAGSSREYNQAALIAKGVSRVWRLPVREPLSWHRSGRRQAKKSSARERVLAPFAIMADAVRCCGLRVCLVDDVYTTGATLRAAAAALQRVGASVVAALVWSRSTYRVGS